jgi:hypothetical protein
VIISISIIGLIASYLFARPLNALQLGQAKATHLGINASTSIQILFVIASLMAGACVSVAGVIGFVGLIIPHMARQIVGTITGFFCSAHFRRGLFLVLSDIIARTIIAPSELPIGVITGMVGGVVFMVVLSNIRRKSKTQLNGQLHQNRQFKLRICWGILAWQYQLYIAQRDICRDYWDLTALEKTTLFRGIAGDIPLKSGSVNLNDINLSHLTNKQRAQKMAIVSQFPDIGDLTVEDYILLGRLPYRKPFQFLNRRMIIPLPKSICGSQTLIT